ncbi:hypothetical protein [Burkholderia stagnalis]|uniref:hypothetical protein n=1 Tax=Burkholderia stagnalis TaxID=1503054 RepID=UPI000AD2CC34|nr:hypothetical protein [Burkholderia stagnalis]
MERGVRGEAGRGYGVHPLESRAALHQCTMAFFRRKHGDVSPRIGDVLLLQA